MYMNKVNTWYTIIKKSIPFIIIIIFAIIGIIGYSFERSTPPIRVLFKSTGGYVIFAHQAHVKDEDLGKGQDCHHNMASPGSVAAWKCTVCHNEGSEYANICEVRAPHRQCVGAQCVECHTKMGRDPKDCSFFHKL